MNCNECKNNVHRNNIPHNQNAPHYDFVMQKRFGSALNGLTNINLNIINQYLMVDNAKILDLGAGTGRLSIPMAKSGHSITAVDQCLGMLDELDKKLINNPLDITCHFDTNCNHILQEHDLAIALFTVMAYSTTLEQLKNTLKTVYDKLKQGAYFIFDLEKITGYQPFRNGIMPYQNYPDLNQQVVISFDDTNPRLGYYQEACNGNNNGVVFNYEENFNIMFWEVEEVIQISHKIGFEHLNTLQPIASADYIVLRKK
jgi:hypothetical protein